MSTRLVVLVSLLLLTSYLGILNTSDIQAELQKEISISTESKVLPGQSEQAVVGRVIDGDTIRLTTGEVVRYIGIDTPETTHPQKSVECFGIEASEFNRALVEGQSVRLEKDISDKDKYGRLLRYVWIGDKMVNEVLVKKGYAVAATYPPDVKYKDLFLDAQISARENDLGLWSACET